MEVEAPDVAKVYELAGMPERFGAARFDFPHNYNRTSREAMYPWFARWLQGRTNETEVAELPYSKPSERELQVLALIVAGRTDREIAETLFIGRRTAQGHVANILGKLGVAPRTAAVTAAQTHNPTRNVLRIACLLRTPRDGTRTVNRHW